MTPIQLALGQPVTVKNESGKGLMHGTVTGFASQGHEAVITPDSEALRDWFPRGYVVGSAHCGAIVVPRTVGTLHLWRHNQVSEPFILTYEEIGALWQQSEWPDKLMPLDRKLRGFLTDPGGPIQASWDDAGEYDGLLSYVSDLA